MEDLTGYELLDVLEGLVIGAYHGDDRHELLNFIDSLREGLPLIFGSIDDAE
ncbi:hypothetical protein Q5O14_15070 [Eubacteriaceae bacterium ES2]|jgi:hypothetical protein|nr:hypothetical protein [Eubacteriaceae bacterium]MDK2904627.1 hypothetical protein [Eubacteriaceae bacterium]MDK2935355.1 hypothetical protein [Eubacteriaceae bacterium]MDK2962055.1 hypothetical protein [Eubacteriaceae bacterium]WKY43934.1 hypothetical protein Q5O14_15070 [Eubacteriaceae bacterium ES2]